MKPIRFSNIFTSAIVLSMAATYAGTPTPAPAPAAAPAANWVSFSLGGAWVNGDNAGMMRRTGTNGDDIYGGIDSFQYSRAIDSSTTLTIDGHAMFGLEDYELNVLANKEGTGYIKAGYKQFRTWYDNSGGYSTLAGNPWVQMGDDERYLDRGNLYLEAGLRMADMPEVTFRYSHAMRDGEKDSLAWGDNAKATAFKLVPSLWNIDETVDTFELDIEHTIGKTELGLGLVWEHTDYSNTRTTPRGVTTNQTYNSVQLTDNYEDDLFSSHAYGVTRFSDTAWLSYAMAYSTMDSDIDGGTRSYTYAPGNIPGSRDYSYDQMVGGSNMSQFISNVSFMWVPVADFTVTPSLRYEHETLDTISQFRAYNSTFGWQGAQALGSFTEMDSWTGALDLRYTAIENVVLYGKMEFGTEQEDITRQDLKLPGELLASDVDIDEQEYIIGANWYALSNLSFGIQALHAERDQSLGHYQTDQPETTAAPGGANNLRPLMTAHNTETDDFNLRATWRPLNNLSLVTRYDYAQTQYENAGIAWTAPAAAQFMNTIDSGEVESHIISESITWSPMARLYIQGTFSYVMSDTSTPMGATTPTSDNDFITCGLSAGYAIDDRTDITASYSYYSASNYAVAPASLGYGFNTDEHAISLTLSRMINENMVWKLSYGFITSNTDEQDQSGGFNDFEAHMISTGLQIRF